MMIHTALNTGYSHNRDGNGNFMTTHLIDQNFIDTVSALIKEAATKHIMPYYKNLQDGQVGYKESELDPVSIADREAEIFLREKLQPLIPDSGFVGEESYALNRSLLNIFDNSDAYIWVLDPIDGTNNFVGGQGGFGPMLALVKDSKVLAGWTYNVIEDKLLTYSDATGIRENGRNFDGPVAPCTQSAHGFMGLKISKIPAVLELINHIGVTLERGSDPSIICLYKLLKGDLDFLIFYLTFPWDHIMFHPMLRDRGFIVKNWYDQDPKFSDWNRGLLIAKNDETYRKIKTELVDKMIDLPELDNLRKKYED